MRWEDRSSKYYCGLFKGCTAFSETKTYPQKWTTNEFLLLSKNRPAHLPLPLTTSSTPHFFLSANADMLFLKNDPLLNSSRSFCSLTNSFLWSLFLEHHPLLLYSCNFVALLLFFCDTLDSFQMATTTL